MKEITMNADEMDGIIELIKTMYGALDLIAMSEFQALNNSPFYLKGQAEEEVKRILAVGQRKDAESFSMEVLPDYYGKVQALISYYSLLSQYCLDAMQAYKDKDKEIADLLESYQQEVIED